MSGLIVEWPHSGCSRNDPSLACAERSSRRHRPRMPAPGTLPATKYEGRRPWRAAALER
ncbi:hypothetical protein [Arthrobacter alpinus]|uniref:hypothetical protein n=1 Tax=Arthrobacter alpinus TaxID=656366 RepID=UPI00138F333A|nr:hypothetical protein [Arthrobacter alpinus]